MQKKGRLLRVEKEADEYSFAGVISLALLQAAESSDVSIKLVANWTETDERTVKNWFSGRYSPSAEHLVTLMGRCDGVLVQVMRLAGRSRYSIACRVDEIELRLMNALYQIRELRAEREDI